MKAAGSYSTATFLTPAICLNLRPGGNKERAATKSLYLNNVIHDELYRHGFTEAAGNFQENNFGRGGRGSDSVNAEAQDGGGTDNANFATPREGQNPRMQMYLWTGAGGTHSVVVHTPASIDGTYPAKGAEFGAALNRPWSRQRSCSKTAWEPASDPCERSLRSALRRSLLSIAARAIF